MIAPICCWCGEPERVEVHEAWGHEFMLDCCCETRQQFACEEMRADADYGRHVLEAAGVPVRRVVFADEGFGDVLLDFEPDIREVTREEAQEFVAEWHRHNVALPVDQWRFGIWNGPTLLGVVVGGAPTARGFNEAYQAKELCEVRRVCIRDGLPKELTWKACSLLYKRAEIEAEARGFRRVITYTRTDESGMSLRYARWRPEATTAARSWAAGSRRRADHAPPIGRIRWAKKLRPAPAALALPASPVVARREANKDRQGVLPLLLAA